ncbi:DNA polymerase III subunit gamma/tau C-terminal domain-containing protein [Pokkaliibacter sp. CJK22405]|uniref:DNA polymerase III subunit gamma/tau C-terminal domain-containing protein n=1 Tax=Pokkaliibacter sp. CJK22405 TaxID=3384615 RepID=UPI003984BCCD
MTEQEITSSEPSQPQEQTRAVNQSNELASENAAIEAVSEQEAPAPEKKPEDNMAPVASLAQSVVSSSLGDQLPPLEAYADMPSDEEDDDDSEMLDVAFQQADQLLSAISETEMEQAEEVLEIIDEKVEDEPESAAHVPAYTLKDVSLGQWPAISSDVPIRGVLKAILEATEFRALQGNELEILCEEQQFSLFSERQRSMLEEAFSAYFCQPVQVKCAAGHGLEHTATVYKAKAKALRQQQAEQSIHENPTVQRLLDAFEAIIQPGSIRPVDEQRG